MSVLDQKALTEQRAGIISDINELASTVQRDNRSMTEEEMQRFDSLEAKEKELSQQLETIKRVERSTWLAISIPQRSAASAIVREI